jgi:predicted RNA binding protein YcfA (HicA-like mRNA interferase family)
VASERRFPEVRKMLEAKGYRLDRIRGSHHIFVKAGCQNESVPVHHGKVKPHYVREIEKL